MDNYKQKSPGAVHPIGVNWSKWLASAGDGLTITNPDCQLDDGPDNTLVVGISFFTGNTSAAIITGGTLGATYRLRFTVDVPTTTLKGEAFVYLTIVRG